MNLKFSIKVKDYNSKEKIISALTDNGYIVRCWQDKGTKLIGFENWVIDILE